MKSQTSLLNRTLLSHFSGTVFWLTIVFMALNIIALPVSVWIVTFDPMAHPEAVRQIPDNLLFQLSAGQLIIGMIFTVFLAMFLLNYLNDEGSSDFMHGLPVKRTAILVHALITGVIAIVVPLIITGIILLAERVIFIPEIALIDIGKWFLYAVFVHCVIFAIAIFAGFLVNGLFLHMQIIVLIVFLPLALWGLTYVTATILYDGIPSEFFVNSEPVLNATFPYVAVMQLYEGIGILKSTVWGIAAIVLIILSFVLYNSRRNENVTLSFNFKWLRALLVAVTAITGMLAIGTGISMFLQASAAVTVIGFVIGAVISYIIIEMLFQRNARIELSWKSVLTTLIIIIVFWGIFLFGWNRYVNFIPAADEVDSVYISTQFTNDNPELIANNFEEGYLFNDDNDAIQTVIKAHEITLAEKERPSVNYAGDNGNIDITYKMTDGSFKTREFDTIKADSEAIVLASGTDSAEYDIHLDMLANLKEDSEYSLTIGMYDVREGNELAEKYKEELGTLKMYRPDIVNKTGRVDVHTYFHNDDAFSGNYVYGESSVYNKAILDAERADYFSFTEILDITETSEMYTVELSDEEMDTFFDDFKTMPIYDLTDEYELEEVYESNDGRKDMINHINKEGLAPEGNKLLIYSYPDFGGPMNGSSAETDFSILAIH